MCPDLPFPVWGCCRADLPSSKDLGSVSPPDPKEPHPSQPKPQSGEMQPTFQRPASQEGPASVNDPHPHPTTRLTIRRLLPPAMLGICPSENGNTDKEKIFGTVSRHRIKGNFVPCLRGLSRAGVPEIQIPFLVLPFRDVPGQVDSISLFVPHEPLRSGQRYYSKK